MAFFIAAIFIAFSHPPLLITDFASRGAWRGEFGTLRKHEEIRLWSVHRVRDSIQTLLHLRNATHYQIDKPEILSTKELEKSGDHPWITLECRSS